MRTGHSRTGARDREILGRVHRPSAPNINLRSPRTAARGHCLQIMTPFKDTRDLLLDGFDEGELSEDEFLLLNDLNT